MPSKLDAPVLTVDVGLIHKVDTRNVENLFSMWTVFSRCAGSLEEGRRLENLSWRLWNRETFCCEPAPEANATTPAISISRPTESQDIPELSGSLDSVADEEFDADEASTSTSAAVDICRPHVRRQDSMHQSHSRSRGRERHITPDDLEKMVITIKEKKDLEPLSLKNHSYLAPLSKVPEPTENIPEPPSTVTTESKTPSSQSSQSSVDTTSMTDSQSSTRSTTSVVRGFSPSQVSSSYRSIPLLTAPSSIPSDDLVAKAPAAKKQPTFALGGSSGEDSYSEQTNSMESKVQTVQPKKKTMFSFGGASSNEDESSLPKRMQPQSQLTAAFKKPTKPTRTSFKDEVAARTIQEEQVSSEDPFETDDDEVDESAIDDDDDSSEWEDSVEESGRSSIDDKTFFQRVDSQVHLPSRRSLLTTMLHQNDRKNALAAAAAGASRSTPALRRSRTSSPNGPSVAASPDSDDNGGLMMKKGLKSIAENGRAQPMAINTRSASSHNLALSPRTTRRNMLATELTVSLRQHLLWERKQKSQTANAVLKRRHTSHDVANLRQYPDKIHMSDDKELNNSWNEYFNTGLGEYHSKGW